MRLLVDSCVLVWWLRNPASIAKEAREAIAEGLLFVARDEAIRGYPAAVMRA